MTGKPFLILVPTQDKVPARQLINGVEAMVIFADDGNTQADVIAMAKAQFGQDINKIWDSATVTAIVADTSLHGWKADLVISNTNGSLFGEVIVTADGVADPGVKATGTYNLTAGNAANGDTVTIAGKVYTFQTVLTNVDGNVFIGASNIVSIANLVAAVTLAAGSGTLYAAATTANASATAVVDTTTTIADVTAKAFGSAGNALTLAKTGTNGAVSGATLTGGVDADTLDALMVALATAINAAGLAGVSHAAYNTTTQVLTVASAADGIGDHTFTLSFYPANRQRDTAVPGFLVSKVQGGIAGAALTATLAADAYTIPLTSAGMRLVEGTTVSGAVTYPGPVLVSIHADKNEAATTQNNIDTAVMYAGTAADALAYATALYAENTPAPWAGATPAKVGAAADLAGWKVRVQIINPTPGSAYANGTTYAYGATVTSGGVSYVNISVRGSTGIAPPATDTWAPGPASVLVDQTYVGVTSDTIDLVGAGLVTKLNAEPTAVVRNASYNAGTNVLTAAGAADNLGNMKLIVTWVAPGSNESFPIPGFVTAKVDGGVAGAALTATFAADAYTIPQVCAQLRRLM